MAGRVCPTPVIVGKDADKFFEVTKRVVVVDERTKTMAQAAMKTFLKYSKQESKK